MTFENIKKKLESSLSPKRFIHSVNVMDTAVCLAEKYGEDTDKAALAGLLHDCARDIRGDEAIKRCVSHGIKVDEISKKQPELLHGLLGEKLALEQYGVEDRQILEAISIHTMGSPGMDLLAKIIFVADYIEPARDFPAADLIRREAFLDIDRAVLAAVDSTIRFVLGKGGLLHPDTVATRNWIIAELKEDNHNE